MNTDASLITNYRSVFSAPFTQQIRDLIPQVPQEKFSEFIEKVSYQVNAYHTHGVARTTVPVAKIQNQFVRKFNNSTNRLAEEIDKVAIMMDELPFDWIQQLRSSGLDLYELRDTLQKLPLLLGNIEPLKSAFKIETQHAIKSIATEFEAVFGLKPKITAYRTDAEIKIDKDIAYMFVPIIAKLLSISVDYSYRLFSDILPS